MKVIAENGVAAHFAACLMATGNVYDGYVVGKDQYRPAAPTLSEFVDRYPVKVFAIVALAVTAAWGVGEYITRVVFPQLQACGW